MPVMIPVDLDAECQAGYDALIAAGQEKVFAGWGEGHDEEKRKMLKNAGEMDRVYPGGLKGYKENAVRLLKESKEGVNPLDGYTPSVPKGHTVELHSAEYDRLTNVGVENVKNTAFVLVAGGLGERLGYPGIKLSLPVETITEKSFLSHYISYILEWQRMGGAEQPIPLAVMTSDDTHDATQKLLEGNNFFGMEPDQVTLMKQCKVPAVTNNESDFAFEGYSLVTKPHGHGDVHQLLYGSGLTKKWSSEGRTHLIVMQDTHSLVVYKVLSCLGLSVEHGYGMNSISIPRRPGEASGSICQLNRKGSPPLIVNVEYNQLNPLLQAAFNHGDLPGPDGLSPYPGNVNSFVLHLPTYHSVLESSGGLVPEFVNPKYKDETRTEFKTPTRLECMMQDIPKFFPEGVTVGFTAYPRWMYCPVKNSAKDGAAKQSAGQVAACAAAGEDTWNDMMLAVIEHAGCDVGTGQGDEWLGVKVAGGARVVMDARFAPTHAVAKSKLVGAGDIKISPGSVLVLSGRDITLQSLALDGALSIAVSPSASVVVNGLSVGNKGWPRVAVSPTDPDAHPSYKIRGYKTDTTPENAAILSYDSGSHTVSKL